MSNNPKDWNEEMWAWAVFVREDILRIEKALNIAGTFLDAAKIDKKVQDNHWPSHFKNRLLDRLAGIPKGGADPGDPPPPPPTDT